MPSAKSEQSLERSHRRFPPIVAKYEFIQVNLELIAAHAVMGTQQPLLEIANGPVRQMHYRLPLSAGPLAAVGCEARAESQPLTTQ
jgi:hypothetical protein